MKKITILVPESAVIEAVSEPRYLFEAANEFQVASGKPPLFQVELVGQTREVMLHGGYFSVRTDKLLSDVEKTDLILIPSLFGDLNSAVRLNEGAVPWIVEQRERGAEIASLCIGAFLLAKTGLLNGKKCSTHWSYYNEFRKTFPEVEIVEGSIVTEENGIYSSGGANSYWNLLLLLLEKYGNKQIAVYASKYFAIDIDRKSQTIFTIFQGQKDHKDAGIRKAQEIIEDKYRDRITVDELATQVAISRRSFERRFKQATHNTVNEYIQRVKIEAAKRTFESTGKNINEVMFDVGYTDVKAFRRVFKKITGVTPVDYRKKFLKPFTGPQP